MSFDGGYCTGYHYLRETVSWPTLLKVGNGQYKAQYGRNCKSGQKAWTILYIREKKLDYIMKHDKMIEGVIGLFRSLNLILD